MKDSVFDPVRGQSDTRDSEQVSLGWLVLCVIIFTLIFLPIVFM